MFCRYWFPYLQVRPLLRLRIFSRQRGVCSQSRRRFYILQFERGQSNCMYLQQSHRRWHKRYLITCVHCTGSSECVCEFVTSKFFCSEISSMCLHSIWFGLLLSLSAFTSYLLPSQQSATVLSSIHFCGLSLLQGIEREVPLTGDISASTNGERVNCLCTTVQDHPVRF